MAKMKWITGIILQERYKKLQFQNICLKKLKLCIIQKTIFSLYKAKCQTLFLSVSTLTILPIPPAE